MADSAERLDEMKEKEISNEIETKSKKHTGEEMMRERIKNTKSLLNRFRMLGVACPVIFCLGATCNETEQEIQPHQSQPSKSNAKGESKKRGDKDNRIKYEVRDTAEKRPQMSELELRVRQAVKGYPARRIARSLGDDAVPILLSILGDEKELKNWKRTTGFLGHIGSETALEPLIGFLEKPKGILSSRKCHELGGIPFAIGLIAATGSDTAYEYLRSHLREDDWNQIKWTCEYRRDTLEKQKWYFARKAIMGIAITGKGEAKRELQGLLKEKMALPDTNEKAQMVDLIGEALRQLERVQQIGLDNYFDRSIREGKTRVQ